MPTPRNRKPSFGEIAGVPYRQHPRYQGVIAHWIMGEGGGTRVRDISGFGNDMTMQSMDPGTDWVIGQFGRALELDGSNDFAATTNLITLTDLTYTVWVKTGEATEWAGILSQDDSNGSDWAQMAISDTGTLRAEISDVSPTTQKRYDGLTVINDNVSHFLAVTYEVSTDTLRLYIDGIEDAVDKVVDNDISSWGATEEVRIGTVRDQAVFLNGIYDDVRIYDRWLPPAVIWSLYTDPFLEFRRNKLYMIPPPLIVAQIWPALASHIESSGYVGNIDV